MAKKSQKGGKLDHVNYQKQYKKEAREKRKEGSQSAGTPVIVSQKPTSGEPADSPIQAQQQVRAAFALKEVLSALDKLKTKPTKQTREFKAHASAFPAMIQMNGLGQAAAFYLSKGDRHEMLYGILSGWLTSAGQPYDQHSDLLDGVTNSALPAYLVAQAEALALLDWVKKFANAYVRED